MSLGPLRKWDAILLSSLGVVLFANSFRLWRVRAVLLKPTGDVDVAWSIACSTSCRTEGFAFLPNTRFNSDSLRFDFGRWGGVEMLVSARGAARRALRWRACDGALRRGRLPCCAKCWPPERVQPFCSSQIMLAGVGQATARSNSPGDTYATLHELGASATSSSSSLDNLRSRSEAVASGTYSSLSWASSGCERFTFAVAKRVDVRRVNCGVRAFSPACAS